MKDELRMNLQMFAEELAEDDDPNVEDDNLEDEEEDEGEEDDLSAIYEDEEDMEEEPEEEDNAGEVTPPGEQQPKLFTQEEVNDIIGKARIKGREIETVAEELKNLTGMDLPQIAKYVRDNQVAQLAEEKGLTEEEAREFIDNKQKVSQLESQMRMFEEQQKSFSYSQQKQGFLNDPVVKKYEKEIDQFSQNGTILDFETAMNYVLGQKLRSGELRDTIKSGAEKRAMANMQKRSKVAPETSRVSGKADTSGMTKEEKQLAANLGVSPKEWQAYKKKNKK